MADTSELLQTAAGHIQAGRLAEAEAACWRVLEWQPRQAEAMHLLGTIAGRKGLHQEAAKWIGAAVEIEPNRADFYFNLIYALASFGRLEEALSAYARMRGLGQENLDLLNALGLAFRQRGNLDTAIAVFEMALAVKGDFFDALSNLATALRDSGDVDRALQICQRAEQLRPENANVLVNLCGMLAANGQIPEAIATIERAVALQPNLAIARRNRGQLRLLMGDLDGGWPEYTWRWQVGGPELGVAPREKWWEGGALVGRKILLLAEQGFGDAIQFIRYAPMVAERGGHVIAVCRWPLVELFGGVEGVAEAVDSAQALPSAEEACPLLNLPGVFKTNLSSMPAGRPYLKPNAEKVAAWRARLAGGGGRKIGIAWAGGRAFGRDAYRSIPVGKLLALAEVPGVCWVSLQKGDAAKDAGGLKMMDFTAELHDFSDTAALIEGLDLVISADTAVAHLAGALGKAVWVLIPFAPDWRWMMSREDSPWYPTMRLFRQMRRGDWDSPIERMRQALGSVQA